MPDEHHDPGPVPAPQDAIAILDSITEGFYTLDRRWCFGYVNREACRILDRQPAELRGLCVWQAYPGLEGTDIERRYRRAMEAGEQSSFTAWYAGHQRWYEITVYPAADGISVFFRNVTEQRALQDQRDALLAESEHQRRVFETALGSTPDLICIHDLQARVVYANHAQLKTWGVAEAAGRRLAELNHPPELAERHEREIAEAIRTRVPVRGEVALHGTAGLRLYDYIFAPVLDANGTAVAVAATARDITERQLLTERLGESQRLEAIGTLAGGVAHDFNNMLAAILVNMALAEEALAPGSEAAERLQLARRAAEHARSLVRQILTFSRRAPRQQEAQPLQPLVDEAVALLRATLPPAVRLAVRLPPAPAWARVDAAQFEQLLVNLCTNAWQALPEGRGAVRVSLVALTLPPGAAAALQLPPGDYLRLLVADNGAGMDDTVRQHVFEPFFTTKPIGAGTGLGLAVVHGVVKESGGAVRIKSRPGRGTAVAVYLPRQPAADEAVPAPSPVPAAAATAPGTPCVLYVDDDELVSLTAEALLTRAGLPVRCVPDAPTALRALRETPGQFAAVVTDFNMPGMSGLALAEVLKQEAPALPVLIISGLVTEELSTRARALGVRQVVFKEHMFELLAPAVQQALQAPGAAGAARNG